MNKFLLPVILALVVAVSGCTTTQIPPLDKPYIKSLEVQNGFVRLNYNDKAMVGFVVYNPLQVTFSGEYEVQVDDRNCLSWFSGNAKFEVGSKKSLPLTVDISPVGTDSKCVGTHTITVVIKDAVSGASFDLKAGEVNIVQS